jgi:putative addiction module component (TIGR02574 family)
MISMPPIPIPEAFDALSLEEKRAYVLALRDRLEAEVRWSATAQSEVNAVLDRRCAELDADPSRGISADELMARVRGRLASR